MTRNWNRKIEVVFSGKILTLSDVDIEFTYSFNTDENPNELEVVLYNLSDTTINTQAVKNKQIMINAGYEGDVGNIAKCVIVSSNTAWHGVDKVTTIKAIDASDRYLNRSLSKTYKPNTTALEIIRDISNMTGLAMGEISLVKNISYPRGRSVTGRLRDILKSIVTTDCATNLQVKNGVILIRNVGAGMATGAVLSPETGLIGSLEPVDSNEKIPKEVQPDYKAQCLLNYRIGAMARVRIDSRVRKGDAVVLKGSHSGSKDGDFVTDIEIKMI